MNDGGALNGLKLRVGSGSATIGVEIRSNEDAFGPNLAVAVASLAPIAPPGTPMLGAFLLIVPDAVFDATLSVWQGSVAFAGGDGVFHSIQLPVPATAVGLDLYTQGLVLNFVTLVNANTNRVRTSLLP